MPSMGAGERTLNTFTSRRKRTTTKAFAFPKNNEPLLFNPSTFSLYFILPEFLYLTIIFWGDLL
jgi:hypothetical protein